MRARSSAATRAQHQGSQVGTPSGNDQVEHAHLQHTASMPSPDEALGLGHDEAGSEPGAMAADHLLTLQKEQLKRPHLVQAGQAHVQLST